MAGLDDALVSYLTDKYADGEEEPNDATMKEMDDLPDRYKASKTFRISIIIKNS